MDRPLQLEGLRKMVSVPKVIAVCSGKGGVGKTNVAANLAVALGQKGLDVMLLDADVSLANVDVLLGLQPRYNLSHLVAGEVGIEECLLEGPGGVRIVPASSGNADMTMLSVAEQAAVVQAFSELKLAPDVLLLDTAAGISPSVARFAAAAQRALVVVCDEPASITDAYALLKIFSQHYGIGRFDIVTNQSRGRRSGARLFEKLNRVSNAYLDVVLTHAGDVQHDSYLVKAVQQQRAVVEAFPSSPAALCFHALAERVRSWSAPDAASGGIEFFLERLVSGENLSAERVA
ncbi:MAG: MinD/ParA family protein [Pseudomonadota bacterium]